MKAKVGSVIDFGVVRNGKEIYRTKAHNVPGNEVFTTRLSLQNDSTTQILLCNQIANSQKLDGTFSQSGTTITRESGTGDIGVNTNGLLMFADGSHAYHVSGTGGSAEVSRSQTVSTQELYSIDTGANPTTDIIGSSTFDNRLSEREIFISGTKAICNYKDLPLTVTAGANEKCYMIVIRANSELVFFYLENPFDIQSGDDFYFYSLSTIWDYVSNANTSFSSGDIAGIAESGDVEFAYRAHHTNEFSYDSGDWEFGLNQVADEIVSPQDPQLLSFGQPSTTFNIGGGAGQVDIPSVTNNRKGTIQASVTIDQDYTDITQILVSWFPSSTRFIMLVVNFDNPISLDAGFVLNLRFTKEIIPDVDHVAIKGAIDQYAIDNP